MALESATVCNDPGDLDRILQESQLEYLEKEVPKLLAKECLKINCKKAGLKFRNSTPGDDDSFFHAVAEQLEPRQGATQLRIRLADFLLRCPKLKGPEGVINLKSCIAGRSWAEYCSDLRSSNEWADSVVIVAMAHLLQRDILIVTSLPQSASSHDSSIVWIVGNDSDTNSFTDPVLLGHIFANHYQSLQIDATLCHDPDVLNEILQLSQQEWLKYELPKLSASERLKFNCKMVGLKFYRSTPADGNCFFHAVADELNLLKLPNKTTAHQLRLRLVEFLRQNPTLQGPDGDIYLSSSVEDDNWENYLVRLKHSGEWADAVAVVGMAHMLKHDILIVTSAPSSTAEDSPIVWIVGDFNFSGQPLLLGHIFENHYQGLQLDGKWSWLDRFSRNGLLAFGIGTLANWVNW